ncbi:MAG: NAD(P)H-dependent oxidoreductase [Desulfovibrio sp.]|nr:NAD(P)H-dependent oxidoreductase [Desulfovibrio sp.]
MHRACLVLSCSPRAGGNSDTAARLFCRAFEQGSARPGRNAFDHDEPGHVGSVHDGLDHNGRAHSKIGQGETDVDAPKRTLAFYLRDYALSPCTACDACERAALDLKIRPGHLSLRDLFNEKPFPCPAAARDDGLALLRAPAEARELCIVSPVYFYHLPAQLKALLDRMQLFRAMREHGHRLFHGPERLCRIILIGGRTRGAKLFAGSLLSLKYALATMRVKTVEPLLLYGLDAADALRGNREAAERIKAYGREAGAAAVGDLE